MGRVAFRRLAKPGVQYGILPMKPVYRLVSLPCGHMLVSCRSMGFAMGQGALQQLVFDPPLPEFHIDWKVCDFPGFIRVTLAWQYRGQAYAGLTRDDAGCLRVRRVDGWIDLAFEMVIRISFVDPGCERQRLACFGIAGNLEPGWKRNHVVELLQGIWPAWRQRNR